MPTVGQDRMTRFLFADGQNTFLFPDAREVTYPLRFRSVSTLAPHLSLA